MKIKFICIFIITVFIASYIYAQGDEPFIEGDKLEFQLTDIDGNTVTSNDTIFHGKVVYITLWGTWCPPCISEIPTLIDLQQKYCENCNKFDLSQSSEGVKQFLLLIRHLIYKYTQQLPFYKVSWHTKKSCHVRYSQCLGDQKG